MAYTALVITDSSAKAAETDGDLTSSFIPAYPETPTGTTFNEALYWSRQQSCNKMRA